MKTSLSKIIEIKKGKKPISQSKEKVAEQLPYVDIKAFETGIVDNYTDGKKCVPCEDGDLLIVCDGSRSGLIGKAIKGYVGSTLARVDVPEFIEKDYLFYFIQGRYSQLNTNVKGTGTPHLNQELLKSFEIFLPELSEQQRIVERIEELFSQLDSAVETLQKTKQQLAVYRQAVLKEAFECCTQKISVESVCEHVTDGDHMPPPKSVNGVPFIMISNIKNNVIDFSNTAFVGRDYYEKINNKRRPRKGDVLYTVTGSFGIPIVVDYDKEFCFQRHIALLRPKKIITQRYLYYVLQTPYVYSQATSCATGTAQKTVGLNVLRKMRIPFIDSIEEQEKIITELESKISMCENIEKTVDTALQQAEAMRQSILKKAFEGKLI